MGDPSALYLEQRLWVLEARVRAVVAHQRAGDPDVDNRFRGLYISDTEVDTLLTAPPPTTPLLPEPEVAAYLERLEADAAATEAAGVDLRLRSLARAFELEPQDVELLLVAVAPDLDPRFERLYAYLHDDVSRRRASAGLALRLCGAPVTSRERGRLGPAGPLVAGGLLLVEEEERPFLTRSLRVPDRVTAHLLGEDTPDPVVEAVLSTSTGIVTCDAAPLVRALEEGQRLVYLREAPGGAGVSMAAVALDRWGRSALVVDLTRLRPTDDLGVLAHRAAREARLQRAGLVAGPTEAIADRGPDAVRAFAEQPGTVFLYGSRAWDPQWSRPVPFVWEAPVPALEQRASLWRTLLGEDAPGDDAVGRALHFRLSPEQIERAAAAARLRAAAGDRPVDHDDVRAGARAQNAAGLDRLARRIEPRVGWDDLVLPPHAVIQLRELVARVRQREHVLDQWGMGRRSSKGRGIKALFAGDSGTGKTISAEVVAQDLGLDLYVIDLSTVVDKYVGETEKNLDRIFAEADRINGVLLFDEADALFGKRSEVKDAQDRYANVEVAYLLQRMELFDGLAVLTTNLRSNLDEAFARRLDAIVDFPMPEEEDRLRLWEMNLSADVPRSPDLDLPFLARSFKISGGNIRNIALTAAFLAAEEGRAVSMADLIRGTEREYRKLGHLCVEAEFGPYLPLLTTLSGGS